MKFKNLNKVNDGESWALGDIDWNHVPVHLLESCACSFATRVMAPGAIEWISLLRFICLSD